MRSLAALVQEDSLRPRGLPWSAPPQAQRNRAWQAPRESGLVDAWLRRREVPMTEKVKFIRGNDRINL